VARNMGACSTVMVADAQMKKAPPNLSFYLKG